jgi:serralysin
MTHEPTHAPSGTLSHDASEMFSFDGYDLWAGTSEADRVGRSDDRMDIVFGRDGSDRIESGGADDDLLGGAGNDRLTGAAGADHLDGGSGNDQLEGGDEVDGLRGAGGNDRLDEGAGHGDIEGGPGNDVLIGGPGADAIVVDLEAATIGLRTSERDQAYLTISR